MTMSRDGILAKNNEFDHRSWVRPPKNVLKKVVKFVKLK